jgi:flagellar hook protein FlgE
VSGIHLPGLQFADGAASPNLTWDILDASGTPVLTQTAANSAPSQPYQDGCSSGTLDDYSVNADGTVEGKFSNGKTMAVAKLALATFSNLAGLERAGSNSYVATLASGEPAIGIPQAGGRGKLAGGSLEMSNVDMSKEFSSLIVTQRGFQANAKVITTFDEVTQAAINLKQ